METAQAERLPLLDHLDTTHSQLGMEGKETDLYSLPLLLCV